MIVERPGADLFDLDADALVNPVNSVGVSGKGLAKEFKDRWPEIYSVYRTICLSGLLDLGQLFVAENHFGGPWVVHFPTKRHWRESSPLWAIESGLAELRKQIENRAWETVGLPAIGCGYGGLAWSDVRTLIYNVLDGMETTIWLIPPR